MIYFSPTRTFLTASLWMAIALPGWGQAATGTTDPGFDVVSVKLNKSTNNMTRMMVSDRQLSGTGITLKQLILYAYNLKMEDQIVGLSGQAAETRFDVEAKVDDETIASLKKLPQDGMVAQRSLMTQAMLADRFKLTIHRETKELPLYSLVVAKSGFKLKEADPANMYPDGIKGPDGLSHAGMMHRGTGTITAQAIPIDNLASTLGQMLRRIVTNNTGLAGKYDLSLQWTPDDNRADGQDNGTPANSGPSLFTALQEQLGLKLEPTKGPVQTIVVDHAEMPSEN